MASNTPNAAITPRPSRLPVRSTPSLRPRPSTDVLRQDATPPIRKLLVKKSASQPLPARAAISCTSDTRTPSTEPTTETQIQDARSQRASHTPTSHEDVFDLFKPAQPSPDGSNPSAHLAAFPGHAEDYEITSAYGTASREPRPSLSDRTKETLASIPTTPGLKKRQNSFYHDQTSSRPTSSHEEPVIIPLATTTRSTSFRSSAGSDAPDPPPLKHTESWKPPPALTSPMPKQSLLKTPLRIKSYANLPKSSIDSGSSPLKSNDGQVSPSPQRKLPLPPTPADDRTITPKSLKKRSSIPALFRKASVQKDDSKHPTKKLSPTLSETSKHYNVTTVSKLSSNSSVGTGETVGVSAKSSVALREQIAKDRALVNKAAHPITVRSSSKSTDKASQRSGSYELSSEQDPFNQESTENLQDGLIEKRVHSARTDGRLNIAAMNLTEIPKQVLNMYNLDNITSGSWAESVDLTRFNAADNAISSLSEDVFPDVDPSLIADEDDARGNQFGGLQTLDLHGNLLTTVPMGLRRLGLLTTLNLSNNMLDNSAIEIVSSIPGLRDLKLAGNRLTGLLPDVLGKLINLETLDVHGNTLTQLPTSMAELDRLRVLNISDNQFESLPFKMLQALPLVELSAPRNKLSGTLIDVDELEMPSLQILDISTNSITWFAAGVVKFPLLHLLNCSSNRLQSIPEMSEWKALLTLSASDNNIMELPTGFADLCKVRNADFSSNCITTIEERIGLMDSLNIFRISGNPLRDKKLSSMSTEDLKRLLKTRIAPEDPPQAATPEDAMLTPLTEVLPAEVLPESPETPRQTTDTATDSPTTSVSPRSPSKLSWPVRAGVLDRSNTELVTLNPVAMAQLSVLNSITTVTLHHNLFQEIPSSIAFFAGTLTHLSLAHNNLCSSIYLREDLELPVLTHLDLSSNTFSTLQPLITHLHAPNLTHIDISFNRLTSLPPLRPYFPSLTSISVSNNAIRELFPDAVRGLRVLDCSSNELSSLNARIGLVTGLERLDVSGNRFRVPKYTVLEKGTEATLAWLRDRIPVTDADFVAWRAEYENDGDSGGSR